MCRMFSPVPMSVDAKIPFPMPPVADPGVVFVSTARRGFSVDMVDGIRVSAILWGYGLNNG